MKLHFHIFNLISIIAPGRMHRLRVMLARLCGFAVDKTVAMENSVTLSGTSISIHRGCWLSAGVCIFANERGTVTIDECCDIGHFVKIVTGSHRIGNNERRAGTCISLPVRIGSGTWIGCGTVILGGAIIGKGTIIAAGSVVRPGVYPDNVLLAGCPAIVKRSLDQ